MDTIEHSFLGRGWSFPPTFSHAQQRLETVAELEDIVQSLQILMTTTPGERLMQPSFGCNLEALLFATLDTGTITFISEVIETAILYHEPRIKPNFIEIEPEEMLEGIVRIRIDFTVRATNSRFNFVFPFYKEEGINLEQIRFLKIND